MYSIDYLAGIFDGEGYSSIAQRTRSGFKVYSPYIGCTNTYKPVIEAFRALFGGSIYKSKGINHPCYNWIVSNKLAYDAAKVLITHCHIKKNQLQILIEWRDRTLNMTKCGGKTHIHAVMHELYSQISEDYITMYKGAKYAKFA